MKKCRIFKKKIARAVSCTLCAAMLLGTAAPQVLAVPASATATAATKTYRSGLYWSSDSLVSEAHPDTNYGSDKTMRLYNYPNGADGQVQMDMGIFNFGDIPTILPDASKLVSAKVVVSTTDDNPPILSIHDVKGNINCNSITYNSVINSVNSIYKAVATCENGSYEFELTDLFQRILMYSGPQYSYCFAVCCLYPGDSVTLHTLNSSYPTMHPYLELVFEE